MEEWLALWYGCVNVNMVAGMAPSLVIEQWCWPDGRPGLVQTAITHQVFRMLRQEAQHAFSLRVKKGG